MKIGIFTEVFQRSILADVLQAVESQGIHTVQFDLSSAHMPSLPLELDLEALEQVKDTLGKSGIHVAALSGTFNMIHPVPEERERGLTALENIAKAAPYLGTDVITLCTGTMDPNSMWRFHPDNNSQPAWDELLKTMERALKIAEAYNVILAFEPELSNVINTAEKGKRLLNTFGTRHLKVIMDGANLIPADRFDQMHDLLDEAFELLGEDIVIAHAKDFSVEKNRFVSAGQGDLDYGHFVSLLKAAKFDGALILHSLSEEQVTASHSLLKGLL